MVGTNSGNCEFEIGGVRYAVVADLHTHTRYSHGRGSVDDIVKAALNKGLKQVGVAEHGPGHFGFGVTRRNLVKLKADIIEARRKYPDIEILFGVEANITGPEGRLDIRRDEYGFFDFVCAGWHFGAVDGMTLAGIARTFGNLTRNTVEKAGKRQLLRNTDMLIRAARTGALKFLTHPGEKAPADMLKIALACAESGTLLEINTHHMSLTVGMLKLIMHTDVRFILSSDAHTPKRVGDFQAGIDLIIESGLDPARVENLKKIE